MSLVTNIANMFRHVQATVPMGQQNPGAAEGAPPAGTAQPNTEPPPQADPLDAMKAVWQTDPNAKPPADPLAGSLFNTDPAKIREAASKMDFTANIPQDLMQKVLAGGDTAAIVQMMNTVAQNALATATQLTTATVEQGAAKSQQRMLQALPGKVRDIQLQDMTPENPVLQHEAVQPMLNMVRSQLRMQNPNMPPAEVSRRAEEYMLATASALTGSVAPAPKVDPNAPSSQNWDIFLNE